MSKERELSLDELEKIVGGRKGPKMKWDYSQYDDYPEIVTMDLQYDPYEGDNVSGTILRWRISKRGFKESPDEKTGNNTDN